MLVNLADKVSSQSTAILVIDIQNDFCADDGFYGKMGSNVKVIQNMVPRLEQFIEKGREANVPIIFIRANYDEVYLSDSMRLRRTMNNISPTLTTGSWGANFYHIRPLDKDPIIDKHRYNAFTGTALNQVLNNLGVATVICTGTATNVCLESTARDAFFHDYNVVIVDDCS